MNLISLTGKMSFFAGIKLRRSEVLPKFANSQFYKKFAYMFGADSDYMTTTKKANSSFPLHK